MEATTKDAAKGSWRTTVAGLLVAMGVAGPELAKLFDADPLTSPAWGLVIGAFAAGLGLGAAADHKAAAKAQGGAGKDGAAS